MALIFNGGTAPSFKRLRIQPRDDRVFIAPLRTLVVPAGTILLFITLIFSPVFTFKSYKNNILLKSRIKLVYILPEQE